MAVASGCFFVSFGHASFSMDVFSFRPVQSSEELNEFLFSKTNEFVGFFDKGIAASDLASITCCFEFPLIVVVKLFDFLLVLLNDHLFVMFRSISKVMLRIKWPETIVQMMIILWNVFPMRA
jgi:hypothetical protein